MHHAGAPPGQLPPTEENWEQADPQHYHHQHKTTEIIHDQAAGQSSEGQCEGGAASGEGGAASVVSRATFL